VSDVRLLVSELASNAVKHAGGEPYVLELDLDALRLRVAIADHGPGFAARDAHGSRLPATTLSEGGYGLGIIERLASRWGVERADRGGTLVTRVWFELDRASR
jgi:anti-sigma regulatory factor (Ser/Thr protein kinase)